MNYQGNISKGTQGNYRVTATSRDPPKIGPSTAPDGYQSYRETQNRLMSSNQHHVLAGLRGNAHQSFESISQPTQTGQRTGRQPETYYRGGHDLQDGSMGLHNQTIVQSYNDFKNVLHPADPSLSPNKISLHGLGLPEGDASLKSSRRLEAQQVQGGVPATGKKTGRNKQLQI